MKHSVGLFIVLISVSLFFLDLRVNANEASLHAVQNESVGRNMSASTPENAIRESAQADVIRVEDSQRDEEINGSTINVSQPRFVGGSKRTVDELNRLVQKTIQKNLPRISTLKKGTPENFSYECSYSIVTVNADLVSIDLNFSSFTGGAHPNGWMVPFNYKITDTGPREITIHNVFGKRTDLKKLQKLLRPRLIEYLQSADDQVNAGTSKLEDLACFNIGKDGLTFSFQQYQVSGYVSGSPSIALSYNDLDGMFDATSPIFKLIQNWK